MYASTATVHGWTFRFESVGWLAFFERVDVDADVWGLSNPAATLHFCILAFWECFDRDDVARLCKRSVGTWEEWETECLLLLGSVCETLDERDERRDDMTGLDGKPGFTGIWTSSFFHRRTRSFHVSALHHHTILQCRKETNMTPSYSSLLRPLPHLIPVQSRCKHRPTIAVAATTKDKFFY
jgi:hypothetical protein